MASRVEIDPGAEEHALAAWREFADSRLGPEIADDARRYCPVRTGALKASIEHHMEDDHLIVSASGGGEDSEGNLYVSRRPGRLSETAAGLTHPNPGRNMGSLTTRAVHHVDEGGRTYALYVEMGHRVYHPSTRTTGPEVVSPRPFLRPALYTERSE
jgi:hypothetical protein